MCGRCRRLVLAAASLISLLALSSCANVDAQLSIAASGACSLKLRYAVSKMVVSLDAVSAGRAILPFPLSREAFDRTVRAAPGTELVSYSQAETDRDLVVAAELRFSNPSSLAAFLSSAEQRASYAEAGGQRSFHLLISPGKAAQGATTQGGGTGASGLDPDLGRLVDAAFAPYSVKIAVALPSPAKSVKGGTIGRGGLEVDYSNSVSEIAKNEGPTVLDFSW